MSLFQSSGGKKVRYAVVGLGDISQEAMLPGIAQTGNSEVTAFVTSDAVKARDLKDRYNVEHSYRYEQFNELLGAGLIDAIYLATPNWRHAEFAVPALQKGIHVLLEKPMEVSLAKCQEILDAQKETGAKLMIAYRLHFEPATLSTLDLIRSGDLGDLRIFNSTFCQKVDPANHRAQNGVEGGPLFDMGTYPINAARYIFGDEPIEVVSATASRNLEAALGDLDDTIAATLRFPGDRLASFIVSYAASAVDAFTVVGTKGSLEMNPAFGFGNPLEQFIKIDEKESHKAHKSTDQFGGEMKYFSECILQNESPEPDGEEGYADVRVIEGILRAIKTGRSQKLEAFVRSRRIDTEKQEQRLKAKSAPKPIHAASPTGDR